MGKRRLEKSVPSHLLAKSPFIRNFPTRLVISITQLSYLYALYEDYPVT